MDFSDDNDIYYSRGIKIKDFLGYFAPNSIVPLVCKRADKDFSEQIDLLIKSGAEAVILTGNVDNSIKFIQQARELNYAGRIVGFSELDCEKFYKTKELTGDIIWTSMYSLSNNSKINKKFVENFNAEYNCNPTALNALAYNSIFFLAKGLKDNYTPDMITYKLTTSPNYPNIGGELVLNSAKKVLYPVYIYQKNGDSAILIDKVSAYSLRKFNDLK